MFNLRSSLRGFVTLLALALHLFLLPAEAAAQFDLRFDAVSAIGGTSSAAGFNLLAVGGQSHPVEQSSSSNVTLLPGFIARVVASTGGIPAQPDSVITDYFTDRNIVTWRDNSDNEVTFEIRKDGQFEAEVDSNVTIYVDLNPIISTKTMESVQSEYTQAGFPIYTIIAQNQSGRSDPGGQDVPAVPSNCRAAALSPGSIELNWDDNATNEESFSIWRKEDADGDYDHVVDPVYDPARLDTGPVSYPDDDALMSGKTYYYRIRAVNGDGETGCHTAIATIPILSVSPTTLDFGKTENSLTLQISNFASGLFNTLTWQVLENPNKPWITSSTPPDGINDATVTVNVDRSQLSGGNDMGTLSVNSNGGNQNVTVLISKTALPPLPPPPWTFVTTSSNATIAVPLASNPIIDDQPIQPGDAVGVFFDRDGSLECAGFSIWQGGQDMAITAWGDDSQTAEKDGFAEGEEIQYRVWDASVEEECGATVSYQTGGTPFVTNGIYVLSSLVGCGSTTQACQLQANWNIISSYVDVDDPALENLLAAISPNMVIMKDGQGRVYWPEFGINTIGNWNSVNGYQIFMRSAATLSITGAGIQPETRPIALAQNWNLVAHLRSNPTDPAAALASIASALVIAKDGAGNVYWPEFGINTIGQMKPCEGYWMFLSAGATLTYPGNSSARQALSRIAAQAGAETQQVSKSSASSESAVLLVNADGLSEGDELRVYSNGHQLVGSGIVSEGRALVTVWGDVDVSDAVEGAREGQELELRVRSGATDEEKPFKIRALRDGLGGGEMDSGLQFTRNGVWIAEGEVGEVLPETFSLGHNYPNPFNPSTTITYSLPEDNHVLLTIFNVLGQEVMRLVDAVQTAGQYQLRLEMENLSSGLYFYRLEAGPFSKMRKMMVIH